MTPRHDDTSGRPKFTTLATLCACLAGLVLGPPVAAGDDRAARAVGALAPISLDGRLDEPAWQAAPVADGFLQRDPDQGQPATEPTELRLLFDDHALYVGARLRDDAAGSDQCASSRAATRSPRPTASPSSSTRTTTGGPESSCR